MKTSLCFAICLLCTSVSSLQAREVAPPNPSIDMPGYLSVSVEAAEHRATRRLSERDFARFAAAPGTVILDARSKEKFDLLHIEGAVNLGFPDITVASLAEILPDKNTRILIYCNNNFANAERPFPTKRRDASLNLSTYIALYSYGYRNVYELAPLIDLGSSILQFESSTDNTRQAGNSSPDAG